MANYNYIARYYDTLARLVFGNTIRLSQINYIHQLKAGSKVLIVGGGTGWILDHLPDDCTSVTYVDSSKKMIDLARRHRMKFPVNYLQSPIEELKSLETDYDAIILNFFLDQFTESQIQNLSLDFKDMLKKDGRILVTDFVVNGSKWQKFLLRVMYSFFSLTVGLKVNQLPNWREQMNATGMVTLESSYFFDNFIISCVYRPG